MTGSGKAPELYQIEDFVTDESFINYFFHRNTDDEAFWEQWLISHPDNREAAKAAIEILRDLSLTLPPDDYKKELGRIKKAINHSLHPFSGNRPLVFSPFHWGRDTQPHTDKRKKLAKWILPVLLALLTAGTYFLRQYALQPNRLAEKYNDSGKPIVFTLGDGTVVTLAPQSKFSYPSDFGTTDRRVYLDGEAQFQVSHDEIHPFRVYEGGLIATVLGTVFDVKKLAADSGVVVELIKGRLQVETTTSPGFPSLEVILNPDERAVYRRKGQLLYKEKWQSPNDSRILLNHLLFRQNNFEEIAKQLKAVFGITVINQSKKKTWRFTGEFKNTSAINIIESICIVEKLNCEVRGDTVFIK